mgnify:CR=1 FL=1
MAFIDEKGRLFGKIPFLETLALCILIVMVTKMIAIRPFIARDVMCTVVLRIDRVSANYPEYIKPKKIVWVQQNDWRLGEIKLVDVFPVPGEAGKINIKLKVIGKAKYQRDKELRLGNRALYIDDVLPLKVDVCKFNARIISLDWTGRN